MPPFFFEPTYADHRLFESWNLPFSAGLSGCRPARIEPIVVQQNLQVAENIMSRTYALVDTLSTRNPTSVDRTHVTLGSLFLFFLVKFIHRIVPFL
jgi:hypothetical protein